MSVEMLSPEQAEVDNDEKMLQSFLTATIGRTSDREGMDSVAPVDSKLLDQFENDIRKDPASFKQYTDLIERCRKYNAEDDIFELKKTFGQRFVDWYRQQPEPEEQGSAKE